MAQWMANDPGTNVSLDSYDPGSDACQSILVFSVLFCIYLTPSSTALGNKE